MQQRYKVTILYSISQMVGSTLKFLIFVLFKAQLEAAGPLVVITTAGTYQGFLNSGGARMWKGIPYAKPPVGALRFNPPQDLPPLTQPYNAVADAPGCIQNLQLCADFGYKNFCPTTISEDCLYLNIIAPTEAPSDPNGYPVMIWFHGGSLINGAGTVYDGTSFAQTGVVYVTVNYRLNVFGYIATSTLKGNYGFLDQRKSIQWVINNIQAFGGNPSRITIAGESAGAMSVGLHIASPGSNQLFQSAIMESNLWYFKYKSRSAATQDAKPIFKYINCSITDDNCIRYTPWQKLLDAFNSLPLALIPLSPLVEAGGDIPIQPFTAIKTGNYPDTISILTGFNKDEGRVFVYATFPYPVSYDQYHQIMQDYLPPLVYSTNIVSIDNLYQVTTNLTDKRQVLSDILTDYIFTCPLLKAASLASTSSSSQGPIYVYEYKHAYDNDFNDKGGVFKYCKGYACHAMEIPFVFALLGQPSIGYYQGSPNEQILQTNIHNAWTNFITINNPNLGLPVTTAPYLPFTLMRKLTTLDSGTLSTQTYYERNLNCLLLWDTAGFAGLYP